MTFQETRFDWGVFLPRTIVEAITILFALFLFSFTGYTNTALALLSGSYVFWILSTRNIRGYVFYKPVDQKTVIQTGEAIRRPPHFDGELTKMYRKVFGTDAVMVSVEPASQYTIHVIWHDDLKITAKLGVLARKLGIESLPGKKEAEAIPVIFFEVWKAGASALLIKKSPDEWGDYIPFNREALTQGKPRAYIGDTLSGDPIVIDHEIEHGGGVFGTSGSGKSEVFVVHHASMMNCGLNPEIHIMDMKGTPQLQRLKADSYVSTTTNDEGNTIPDLEGAYDLMVSINNRLAERMAKYTAANCDNIWQYRKKVNKNESPICLYIDEWAVMARAAKSAGKDERVKEIVNLFASLAQLGRSGGLIFLVGMQHPLAEDLPTTIRNQIMIRIVLAVTDETAAKVAGIPGAQNQPMMGGMMVKAGNKIRIGRGAYIPAE